MILDDPTGNACTTKLLFILRDQEWESVLWKGHSPFPEILSKDEGKRLSWNRDIGTTGFPDADPVKIGIAVPIDSGRLIEPDDHELRSKLADELGEDNESHITHGFHGDFVDLEELL